MKSFKSYWSENILFVGAGVTNKLGVYSTYQIGKVITSLVDGEKTTLEQTIMKVFNVDKQLSFVGELKNFLIVIDDFKGETSKKQAVKTLGISKSRKQELLHTYDWSVLKQIVRSCPRNDNVIQVQDLFNLIDKRTMQLAG